MAKKRDEKKARPGEAAQPDTIEELNRRLREKSPNGHRIETFDEEVLMENLHLVNAYYDRNLPGEPVSTRRFFGPVVAFVKRVIRKVTAWHVNPAMDNQRLFNTYVTRSINELKRYVDHLQINEDILSTIMHRDLALFRANIQYLNRYLERRMLDFDSELLAVRGRAAAGLGLDGGPDGNGDGDSDLVSAIDVLTLEQRVHGSPLVVRDRQKAYLQYFAGCREVLALGCGRGELLELLDHEGIPSRGVETNGALVDYCRDNDLEVVRSDLVEFLEAVEDDSVDGISLARFAGHQPPARLMKVLGLCRKKLADGGFLVIETPNPFSLYAVASYALEDYSMMHPMHPETLKLLCLSYGFVDPEVMFLNPLPPEEHLEEINPAETGATLEPREGELFHQINENFRRINRIIFSHRDYALITRRGGKDSG